jgi:hypothetical protein
VQRARRRFKYGFRDVVLIAAINVLDVQIEAALLDECLKELFNQFRLHVADSRGPKLRFVDQVRTAGEIDNHARQSFIQGNIGMAESDDPTTISESFLKGLAKNPADVFDRVMPIDLQITFGLNFQVEVAVPRKLREHVIEEGNSRIDAVVTGSIEIQGHLD